MIPEDTYTQIVRLMPIPCVDLIVEDQHGLVLLAKRANEPAKGQWWFAGGRVHLLEKRVKAAERKLLEELGINSDQITELGTYDVIASSSAGEDPIHGITTLYCIPVGEEHRSYILDNQNSEADWRLPQEWLKLPIHSFIRQGLEAYMKYRESNRR